MIFKVRVRGRESSNLEFENMDLTDVMLDELFDEFLDAPELSSWASDLSGREYEEARRLFRRAVRQALEWQGED